MEQTSHVLEMEPEPVQSDWDYHDTSYVQARRNYFASFLSQSRFFSMFAILEKFKWDEEEFSGGVFDVGFNLLHRDFDEKLLAKGVHIKRLGMPKDVKDHDRQLRSFQKPELRDFTRKKTTSKSLVNHDVKEICERISMGTELRESESYWQYQVQKWKNTQLPEIYLRMMPQSDRLADMLNTVHGFQERMLYKEEYERCKKEEQERLNEFKQRRSGNHKEFWLPLTFAPPEKKSPLMLALEKRIEDNLSRAILTIVHLRVNTPNGLECSALIDLRDRLLREDLNKFFLGDEKLIPKLHRELSYYQFNSNLSRCNNTSTFIHIKNGNGRFGMLLRCTMSYAVVNFDLKVTCPKIYKYVIEDDGYKGCVIYDYVPGEYLSHPKPNLVVAKPDDSRVTTSGTKEKTIEYNWCLGPHREAYCSNYFA